MAPDEVSSTLTVLDVLLKAVETTSVVGLLLFMVSAF